MDSAFELIAQNIAEELIEFIEKDGWKYLEEDFPDGYTFVHRLGLRLSEGSMDPYFAFDDLINDSPYIDPSKMYQYLRWRCNKLTPLEEISLHMEAELYNEDILDKKKLEDRVKEIAFRLIYETDIVELENWYYRD